MSKECCYRVFSGFVRISFFRFSFPFFVGRVWSGLSVLKAYESFAPYVNLSFLLAIPTSWSVLHLAGCCKKVFCDCPLLFFVTFYVAELTRLFFILVSEYPKLLFWPLLRTFLSLWWISFDFVVHVYIYLYIYLHWELLWRHIVGSQKRLQNGNAMLGINFRPFTFLEVSHVCPWNSFWLNCPTKCEAPKTRSRFNLIFDAMLCCIHNSGSLYWATSKYFYTTCYIHPFTHRLVDAFFHVYDAFYQSQSNLGVSILLLDALTWRAILLFKLQPPQMVCFQTAQ